MSPAMWGGVLGATAALGLLVAVARVHAIRRPQLALRVLPYVRDLPQVGRTPGFQVASTSASPASAAARIFGPFLRAAAEGVERVLGGATSVRRRLERAGIDKSVHDFRIEQVTWGLAGFSLCAAWSLLRALTTSIGPVVAVLLCLAGFAVGVVLRENRLSSQATARERRIVVEFPTVAELLALAVAAGESPVSALDRVVRRSGGELSRELAGVLAAIRTGQPVALAFDAMAASTGLPLVARFARGISVAIERGTPLADVLHAQAADVREAGRRALIESAARREVLMMVPVVFLVLPITVIFAFFPGVVGLSMVVP